MRGVAAVSASVMSVSCFQGVTPNLHQVQHAAMHQRLRASVISSLSRPEACLLTGARSEPSLLSLPSYAAHERGSQGQSARSRQGAALLSGFWQHKGNSHVCRAAKSEPENCEELVLDKPWMQFLSTATSIYPLYIVVGGSLAIYRPSSFAWFVERGPFSYSVALGSIMLAMGLTLRLQDLLYVLMHRPLAVLFGCAAQYGVMPLMGAAVSRLLGLSPELSAGLILLACCPGGTASNVVTLIAEGDVPLSILMTICTTFGAVIATPLLTQVFAGAYVPVDVLGLAISTLQVVLVPVLLGAWLQTTLPKLVGYLKSFSPLVAVLTSSLLSSSVFSANVSKMASLSSAGYLQSLPTIVGAVMLVHAAGFLLGYALARMAGYGEKQLRAISIEVGMQNSSLGVVLASTHFSSPLTSVPAAISGMIMNIMASLLAVCWKRFFPLDKIP